MRKTLAIALMALGVMSCAREEEMVTARFGYADYETGNLTKAETQVTIKDVIQASMPTTITLDLCSEATKQHYSSAIGQEVYIPAGRYNITGNNETPAMLMVNENEISTTPKIAINQDVDITSERKDYPLFATFGCFAIVIDFREISSVTIDSNEVEFFKKGNYGIVYVNKFVKGFNLKVNPATSTANESKTFYFSNQKVNGYVFCQKGYYYFVHPKMVQLMGMKFVLDIEPMRGQDVK